MSAPECHGTGRASVALDRDANSDGRVARLALLGNPNTGKTTLFNRLSGLRHKTSNFPGTTQEARTGLVRVESQRPGAPGRDVELIDLPGVYSLELGQQEAEVCRGVLDGTIEPPGESGEPDGVCVVLDATNLARNLVLAGEALRRRLPTVIAVNMMDLARKRGLHLEASTLAEILGCPVVLVSARTGEGLDELKEALASPRVPNRTPPGGIEPLERWADEAFAAAAVDGRLAPAHAEGTGSVGESTPRPVHHTRLTDRLDRVFTHPILGAMVFALVMTGLFWAIFSLATYPMDWIDQVFAWLSGVVRAVMPEGILRDLLSEGVVAGIGATVIFLPQICLLFFLICLIEDTGYLARAAFLMDRLLRPFGLPGHSFVPLLSSHACALPGIMACRGIPDRRERLATILVAPFMTCSARLPVYALLTSILFPDSPALAALAFVGCYVLGIIAGVLSALLARRTILRGRSRHMALELPSYKWPSLRTALITTFDRGLIFLKKAGTNILAICIVLWWLGAYPHVDAPKQATEMRASVAGLAGTDLAPVVSEQDFGIDAAPRPPHPPRTVADVLADAERVEAAHARSASYMGRIGRFVQPVFEPLGFDWQLSVGVMASFAAREVFASTMAVVVTGSEDFEDQGVVDQIAHARRTDGSGPVFGRATSWSVLVFFVLAMQCLPTLAVTARESGSARWAFVQLAWMSAVAYAAAFIAYRLAL